MQSYVSRLRVLLGDPSKDIQGIGIRVVTGHRYLGGYIGDGEAERSWLKTKIKGWTESMTILAGVARKHPQSAYAGLQKPLQQEWAFVQRVTPGVRDSFGPVEEALKETFVPALFEGLRDGVPERGVTSLHVKQTGLALPDPYQTASDNWTASCVMGPGGVPDVGPLGLPPGGSDGSEETRTDSGGGGSEGRTGGGPGLARTSPATSNIDQGLDYSAAIHSQWDVAGGPVMARRPLPMVYHRWELPGNYRDFIVVMVFYLFCWKTKRILVTPITDFKMYILIQSLMLFIQENNRVIVFLITMAHLYIYTFSVPF